MPIIINAHDTPHPGRPVLHMPAPLHASWSLFVRPSFSGRLRMSNYAGKLYIFICARTCSLLGDVDLYTRKIWLMEKREKNASPFSLSLSLSLWSNISLVSLRRWTPPPPPPSPVCTTGWLWTVTLSHNIAIKIFFTSKIMFVNCSEWPYASAVLTLFMFWRDRREEGGTVCVFVSLCSVWCVCVYVCSCMRVCMCVCVCVCLSKRNERDKG